MLAVFPQDLPSHLLPSALERCLQVLGGGEVGGEWEDPDLSMRENVSPPCAHVSA
jgi:hypothetical protein